MRQLLLLALAAASLIPPAAQAAPICPFGPNDPNTNANVCVDLTGAGLTTAGDPTETGLPEYQSCLYQVGSTCVVPFYWWDTPTGTHTTPLPCVLVYERSLGWTDTCENVDISNT